MKKQIRTTVYLDPDLKAYVKSINLNLTKFVNVALRHLIYEQNIQLRINALEREIAELKSIREIGESTEEEYSNLYAVVDALESSDGLKTKRFWDLPQSKQLYWLKLRIRDYQIPQSARQTLYKLKQIKIHSEPTLAPIHHENTQE